MERDAASDDAAADDDDPRRCGHVHADGLLVARRNLAQGSLSPVDDNVYTVIDPGGVGSLYVAVRRERLHLR
jgi:hypothetical protein